MQSFFQLAPTSHNIDRKTLRYLNINYYTEFSHPLNWFHNQLTITHVEIYAILTQYNCKANWQIYLVNGIKLK